MYTHMHRARVKYICIRNYYVSSEVFGMVNLDMWLVKSEEKDDRRIQAQIELIEAGLMPRGWMRVEA